MGFANQAESQSRDDGLVLTDAYITASVRCAPPDNKPSVEEFRNCRTYLERELDLLKNVKVIVVLGRLAFDTYLGILRDFGASSRLALPSTLLTAANTASRLDRRCSSAPTIPASKTPRRAGSQREMLRQIFERARKMTVSPRERLLRDAILRSSVSSTQTPQSRSTLVTVVCLAVAVLSVFGALNSYQVSTGYAAQFPDAYGGGVAQLRFAPLNARLPATAELGYITDIDPTLPPPIRPRSWPPNTRWLRACSCSLTLKPNLNGPPAILRSRWTSRPPVTPRAIR